MASADNMTVMCKVVCECGESNQCPLLPEIHTVKEWAELPDKISTLGKWYVFSDYRTDNDVDIPRFKFGDGKTLVSKLPFCTASITDYDCEYWDAKADA